MIPIALLYALMDDDQRRRANHARAARQAVRDRRTPSGGAGSPRAPRRTSAEVTR